MDEGRVWLYTPTLALGQRPQCDTSLSAFQNYQHMLATTVVAAVSLTRPWSLDNYIDVFLLGRIIPKNVGKFLHRIQHVAAIRAQIFNLVGVGWLILFPELRINIFKIIWLDEILELTYRMFPVNSNRESITSCHLEGCKKGKWIWTLYQFT